MLQISKLNRQFYSWFAQFCIIITLPYYCNKFSFFLDFAGFISNSACVIIFRNISAVLPFDGPDFLRYSNIVRPSAAARRRAGREDKRREMA